MIKYKLDSGRRAVDRLCWRRPDNGSKTTGCSGCAHLCVDRDRCVPLCHAGVQRHGTRSAYSSLPRTFQQNVPPLQVFIHSCAWSCTAHRTATPPLSCNNARRSGMRFSGCGSNAFIACAELNGRNAGPDAFGQVGCAPSGVTLPTFRV